MERLADVLPASRPVLLRARLCAARGRVPRKRLLDLIRPHYVAATAACDQNHVMRVPTLSGGADLKRHSSSLKRVALTRGTLSGTVCHFLAHPLVSSQ